MDRIDVLQTIDFDKNSPILDLDSHCISSHKTGGVEHSLQFEQVSENLASTISFHSLSIINVADDEDVAFIADNHKQPQPISSWIGETMGSFTLLSLLAHIIMLFAVGYTGIKIVVDNHQPDATTPIEAKLVYIPLTPPVPEKTDPKEIGSDKPVADETIAKPKTLTNENILEQQPPTHQKEADKVVNEKQVEESVDPAPPELTQAPIESNTELSPSDKAIPSYSVSESFSRRLEDANKAAVQKMHEDALKTREFDLYGIKNKPNYFEVKAPETPIKPKNVNCENSMSRTMVSMSGLFGGHLKCTGKPDINGFINKRLNKNPEK